MLYNRSVTDEQMELPHQ